MEGVREDEFDAVDVEDVHVVDAGHVDVTFLLRDGRLRFSGMRSESNGVPQMCGAITFPAGRTLVGCEDASCELGHVANDEFAWLQV